MVEERLLDLEKRLRRVEDLQAINNLMARYLDTADGGWDRDSHNGERVAPMFTEDAIWEAEKITKAVGRKEIKALWDEFRQSTPFAFHLIGNPIIEVNGDTAMGEWHLIAYVNSRLALGELRKVGSEQFSAAVYVNHFERRPEGWLFKSILVRPIFFEPFAKGWSGAAHLAR